MLKSKNILLYEAIAIFIIFTIVYFLAANKISYAFAYDESAHLYESKIKMINKSATLYGEKNIQLFEEEDPIYIPVDDLIQEGYILADDEEGKIKDPRSDVKYLNDLKVRISLTNGDIRTKILS